MLKADPDAVVAALAAAKVATLNADPVTDVTFAERPVQSVLDALRAAGYHWSDGAWHGEAMKLPACVGSVPPIPGV